jgi:hypothetical protein
MPAEEEDVEGGAVDVGGADAQIPEVPVQRRARQSFGSRRIEEKSLAPVVGRIAHFPQPLRDHRGRAGAQPPAAPGHLLRLPLGHLIQDRRGTERPRAGARPQLVEAAQPFVLQGRLRPGPAQGESQHQDADGPTEPRRHDRTSRRKKVRLTILRPGARAPEKAKQGPQGPQTPGIKILSLLSLLSLRSLSSLGSLSLDHLRHSGNPPQGGGAGPAQRHGPQERRATGNFV